MKPSEILNIILAVAAMFRATNTADFAFAAASYLVLLIALSGH